MCGHTRALEKTGEGGPGIAARGKREESKDAQRQLGGQHFGASGPIFNASIGTAGFTRNVGLALPFRRLPPPQQQRMAEPSASGATSVSDGASSFSPRRPADPAAVGHRLPRRQQAIFTSGLAGESAASVMRLWLLGVGKGAAQPVAFPAISEGLVLLLDSVHVSTC